MSMRVVNRQRQFPNLKFIFYSIIVFTLIGVIFQCRILWRMELEPQTHRMFPVVEQNDRLKDLQDFNGAEERCQPPSPDPLNTDVLQYLNIGSPLKCKLDGPKSKELIDGSAFAMKKGKYLHRLVDLGVPCCMKNIFRNEEDNGIRNLTENCYPITGKITKIRKSADYVAVECKNALTGDLLYAEAFAVFHEAKKQTPASPVIGEQLNVLVIGMEATSQLNFIRKMPQTYAFLRHNLNAVVLRGYNKVGECTHANIIPMLAGMPTQKFEEECLEPQRKRNVSPKLDNCSLIWKSFSERGYVTFYGEDFSKWGPFDYYWPKPFLKKPTDYYLRPVALYSDTLGDYYNVKDFYCMGPRHGFDVLMDSLKTVASVNKDKPFFQFVWVNSLGYRDMNHQQRGDKGLVETLKYFQATGVLNRTAVFIIGDHGFRKKGYKFTLNGAIEDRMPVGVIALPEWFQRSYSGYYTNLKLNSKVMTSHFDVHKTILDILYLNEPELGEEDYPEMGTSLFKNFPEDRTCLGSGIPLLWCLPCHSRLPLENDLKLEVARFLIDMLNTGVQLCDPFVFNSKNYAIESILFASKWDPRDVQRELCSRDGRDVILPGYYGQSQMRMNRPCESFFDVDSNKIEIISVEFSTEVRNATFMGEVIRYKNETDGKWYFHLTEDIQYNYIIQGI